MKKNIYEIYQSLVNVIISKNVEDLEEVETVERYLNSSFGEIHFKNLMNNEIELSRSTVKKEEYLKR